MRRLLFVLASIIAVLTFSCDTTQPDFDDAVPGVNTLTTTVSPDEGGEVLPSEGEFVEGTTIEIEAVPNTGYTFDRWEGDLVGSLNPTFLSMTDNRSVTAFFSEIEVPLTINIVGEGSVSQEIINQEQEQAAASLTTKIKTDTPTDTLSVNRDGGNQKLQRDGNRAIDESVDGSELKRERPPLPDERIETTEIPQQRAETRSQKAITTLQLTAVPEDGWRFARWEGDLTGSQNPDTLVVETETVVTAIFEQEVTELFTLDLTIEGQGFIEAVPDKLEYTAGEEVMLTAVPEDGWEFSQWSGDLSGSENPGTIIMDSDKQVTSRFVMEGSASMEIVQQPSQTVAGETISPAPAVRFTDSIGEPEEGINIQATLNAESFSGSSVTTVSTSADGVATFEQLSVEAADGNYRIEFEALDSDVPTLSTSQFTVMAAAGDPSASSVSVPDGIAGESTIISISVDDSFGNPVSGAEDQINVAVTGDNSASPVVTAGGDAGSYTAEYTPQSIGSDQIAVTLNGTAVAGSPVESVVTASDVSEENSTADISPQELQVGQEATITVTAKDDQNNPLSGIEDEIQVSGAGDATVSSFTEDGQSGVYSATVTNTVPGELSLTVSVSGVTLEPVLVVTFLTGGAENIEIVSGDNQSAKVGNELPNPIIVRVTDAFGNPVEGETITFTFDETPGAAVGRSIDPSTGVTNTDGEASAIVTLGNTPGTYTVEASAENAGAVTFNFQATIGQASAISITSQPATTVAGESISPSPAVEITDDEGNGIEGIEVSAGLNGGNYAEQSTVQVSTNSSGVAAFGDLRITESGTDYTITFTPASSSVSDITSDPFDVSAAVADPANSTADVPNGSAGDVTEITITLQDEFGNRVEGEAPNLSLSVSLGANSGASFTSVSDEGNGTYQASYIPSATGTDEITIELNDVAIDGSPFVSEVVATDAENIEITVQPQDAVAGEVIDGSPAVLVTDDLSNPIGNVDVTVSVDGGAGISGGTTVVTTDISGTAVFDDLVIETSGSFRLRFDALGVSEDAVSDPFEISAAGADKIARISGNGQTATVSEALDNPFVAEITDPFGNPVSGFAVEFSVEEAPDGAAGQSLSSETTVTDANGRASSILTLGDRVGNYSVSAASAVGSVLFNATAVPGNAQTFLLDEVSSPQTAGASFLISITAFDEFDNIATGYSGTATLSTTAGAITPGSLNFEDGEASQSIRVSGAGSSQTITATDGSISGTSNEFDVQTGGASNAEIAQQPSNTTAGQVISPFPAVEVTDAQGNPISGVSVEAGLNSGGFSSGSATQTTNSNGVAEFGNLTIQTAGDYTILFNVAASGVDDPVSSPFTITPAEADPQNTDASVPNGTAGEDTSILITVEDAFGNRVDGVASELAISIAGANSATPSANPIGDGQYRAVYTPNNSGNDQVSIELNGTPISRSPYSSRVSTSDISSSVSSVSANPETVQAGSTSQVTVQLRDASDNPITGLTNSDYNINVSGNGSAGTVSESSSGTYQFNVRNTTAQLVTVSVNANGVLLDDAPQITFTAADPNLIAIPSGSQPGSSIAGEIITNSPSVRILDEYGNSVPEVKVTVSELNGESFASGNLQQTTNSSGVAQFSDLVINRAAQYRLLFSAQGGLSTTSQSFVVDAAEADAGNTTANVPNGSAGDQTNITITVRDAFDNLVEGVDEDLAVSVSGANSGADTEPVTDEGNGIYSSAYTPEVTGSDQITIELDGAGIQGSPFTSVVITSDAENIAINTQPGNSIAGESIAGPPSVRVTDDLDNSVGGIEVIVSINGPGSLASGTTSVNTNGSGIAEFDDLVIETAGSYTLEFNAIGVSVNAVSDLFDVAPAQADKISRESGTDQSATVTAQLDDPFVVRITDAFDNPVSGTDVEFSIIDTPLGASGQTLSNTSVSTDSEGLAETTLTLGDITGTYMVTAAAGGIGSVSFSATANAAAANSFSFDPITTPQTAGQPFGIRIVAQDSQGNTASGYQGTANLSAASGGITPASTQFTNGVVSLDVELNTAAAGQSITAVDGSITGTSNTFDVESGGVNAANSSVSADRTTLPAGENSTLTIELRDGSNNPVTVQAGDISVDVTGSANAGSVTGDAGTYTSVITNQTAETVTVTVLVNSTTLNDSPSIEFTPAAADDLVLVSGDNQNGAVTEQLSNDFVVRVDDAFDNPVPNENVEFAITNTPAGASGQNLSNTSTVTNLDGEASTRLTLGDTPGTYTVEASISGLGTATFTAEAETGTPSQMAVVTQPENTKAGQPISPAPQVQITDIAGNPVANINVTVSENSGYTFDGGTLTRSTDASGVATFGDLVIETSGRYALVFNTSVSGVPGVTSNLFNVNPGVGDAESSTLEVPDGTAGEETEIKIKVEDEFGNAVDGEESNLSVSVSGANIASPNVVPAPVEGEYSAPYTPSNSGNDTIEATLSGVVLSNSPQFSTVSVSEVSASESIVQANPAVLQVGGSSVVRIDLKDGSGNPIAGLGEPDFFLNVSGNAIAGLVSETSSDGTYEFTVQNTTAQQVQVTVEAQGTVLDDTPQITFNAGDPADISIASNPGSTTAGQIISESPAVEVLDEFDNPVPGADVTVTEQSGQTFASGATTVSTNSFGNALFEDLVINTSGQYNLVFTVGGSITITSNAFSVEPADADPNSTIADVPNGAATNQTEITITVEDPFGNRVEGVAGALAVSIGGANSGAVTEPITDDGNGRYSTNYTPDSAGDDEITITLNGTEISGSPYLSTVSTSEAEAVAVETEPLQTIAGQAIAGPPAARVTDAGNNDVPGIEVIAGLQSGTFSSGTTSVDTDGNGIAAFTDLVLNTAGNYVMEFSAIGVSEDAVSQSFEIIAAGADELLISDGNNQTGTVTESLTESLEVLVTDPFGNPVSNQEVSFDITGTPAGATGQILTTLVAETGLDGLLSTELTLGNRPGTYEVTASSGSLTDVTFTATAEAGPATAYEFDTIPTPQTAGQPFTISLTALDDQGNTADSYGESLTLSASQGTISPATAGFTNGTVSLDVTLDQAGSGITITATDGIITETSNAFDVQTGGIDAANSSVAASPLSLQAGLSSTLTIELRDNNNNLVGGVDAGSFDISLTGDAIAGTITEPATGTYTTNISNETAEVVTASITVNGTLLDDTPQIEFTPADADPAATTANVPNGAAGDATSIVITVSDEFGNPVTGAESALDASVSSGPNAGETFTAITDNNDGTYATSYTPLTIGTDEITITLNSVEISGSPYSSDVIASDVSATNSIAAANPTTLEVGNPSVITLDVRDGSNNSIEGLSSADFNVSASGSATASSVSETSTAGTYEFTVNNEAAETVTVTITATGTTLQDTPEITFTAADPSRITVSTQPQNVTAGESIPGPPSVTLEDTFNNPVPGINVTVSEQGGQDFASGSLTVQTNTLGVATFSDLVITEEGQYNLVFSEPGGVTATSNVFNVTPANADAAFTTADVPNGAATDFTSITITVRDAFGNRVEGVADDLALSISGANEGAAVDPVTDNGNGLYSTGYTPIETGIDEIAITLSGIGIDGSPYSSNVVTSDAENVAVETQPIQTVAGQPVAGPPAARVTDAGANNVSGVEVIAGLISGTFNSGTTSVDTDVSGIATFTDLVINAAGSYTMEFNAVGVSKNASSQVFEIIAADPANLVIRSGNNQSATVTEALANPFVVRVTDEFDNPVESEEISFIISNTPSGATGQSLSAATVLTDSDGLAPVSFTTGNVSGDYSITASGTEIGSVVFTATAEPGAASAFSFDTISSPQTAGTGFTITLSALDGEGNTAVDYNGTTTLTTTAGTINPATADFTSGTTSVNVTVSDAGTDQTITAEDGAITGISNTFDVQSGEVDAANSSVSASPLTLQAGQTSTLTIELRDGSNNIVSGVDTGSFNVTLTGDATAGTITEPVAGTYTTNITNETAEGITAIVTASGTQLNDEPQIEFTPAGADPAATTANVPNGAAGDATSIVITVSDEFGNPVTGAESALDASVSSGPNAGETFTAITDNNDGTYTTSYTPLTIGTDEITITLNSVEIFGSPYSSTVTTSDVSASNSNATASPASLVVGNPSTVTVELRDGSNNPIAGLSSTDFNVSANGSATTSAVSEISGGTYEFTVSNQVAESVTVTVTATGTTLQSTPSIEFTVGETATITVTTQPSDITAGQSIAGPPTVTLEDEFDNPVPGVNVTVSEQGGQTFDSGTLTVQTNASGIAAFSDLVLSSAGQYNLVFNEPGGRTATSNAFDVSAATGNAAQSSATVPNGAAGDATSIVINVSDEFGNPVTGAGLALDVSVTGGPNAGESFTGITDNGDGTYTTSYTPLTTGTDEITITLNSVGISGSPYSSTVTTSDVSASNSSATSSPTSLTVGSPSTVTVVLRDGSDNPITGLSSSNFDVNPSGSATASTVTETPTAGTYQFTVSNQTAESVTVTISATGTTINDAPAITFTAGVPERLIVSTQPLSVTAGESIPGPPSVTLEDQFTNPVPSIDVTVSEQGGQSFASGTLTVQTNASGAADFTDLVIADAGEYNLVFTATGGKTATSNVFDVSPADGDASQTTATVPNGSAGDATTITISVNDAFGNPVTGAAGDLSATVSGANTASINTFTDNGDGTYSASYTPTATGDDTIAITLGGAAIQGSPFTSTVITSDAATVEVAAEPLQTVAGQPVAGPPAALVTDDLSNPVSGIDVVASLSTGSFASGTSTVSSDGNGESVFNDLVVTQAGSYTINFNAQGVAAAATTSSFDVIPATASDIVVNSGNNQTATVTNTLANPLSVQVSDEFGNAVEGKSVSFEITNAPVGATGQSLSATTVQTDSDGRATTSLTLGNVSGDYNVTASGTGLGSVLFTATANAGAASQFVFDTIASPQTAGSGFTISLTAQDTEGNTAGNYSGTATLSTTAGTITPATADFASGLASVNVTVSNAGTGQTITAEDGLITGTSNTFDVSSGGIDAVNSSVSASPLTLQAGQSTTLTIELRDGSNNPVGGVDAGSFTIVLSGNATLGAITEGTSGTYTTSITNQTAETVTATVTVSGTQLNDIPQIEFTAGSLAALTLLSGDNQTGTVAEQLPADFVVEAEDSFGNPVSGVQVNFAIDQIPAGATGQSLTNAQILTGSLGRAFTRLTLGNLPGTYSVDASAAGVGSVTFSAQAEIGEASVMSITSQPGETTAGSAITPSPEVTVTDDAGNPIDGVSVSVSEQGGYTLDGGTLSVLTGTDGTAAFNDLVINTADNYTLVFDADAPAVSDVSSNPFDVVAAAGDPLNSTANVPDGAAGDPTTITITVWDQFNNAVTGADGDLNVSFVAGPNSTESSFSGITDNLDGTYTTSYTPSATGTDEIAITLNGTNIAGTTYFSTVETSDVSASNSSVTASPGTLPAGSNSLITVEVLDGSDNVISGLTSSDFSISVSGNGNAGAISETATDGTYQFNVSNTTAEQVSVSVTATGTTLLNSPTITFTAAAADLMLITQQPQISEAAQPIAGPPTARITDEYGNRVPNVEVTISEQGGQPFTVGSTSTLNTNSLGQAIFDNIAIELAGEYNLVFSVDGITNRTSNLFTVTESDPDAAQTTASVPNGSAGVRTQISITVRDAFGNRVEGASSLIGVQISGANDGSTLEGILDNGDGVYSTAYTPSTTGTDFVAIDIDGTAIPGSPFSSEVTTSDADSVAISQQPLQIEAGNPIAGSPSVTVTDQFGNNVSGIEVTVRESGGADFDAGTLTATTDVNGEALFDDLQINAAGTYTLVFDAVGVELDATSDPFNVVPAAGDAGSTVASVPAGTAGEATTITVDVQDIYGNGVEGIQGDLSVSVTSGANTGAGVSSVVDQGSGIYTATYTPTATGTDTLTVTLSTIAISNSPITSLVSAGAASTLEISQQPTTTEAGSLISPSPTSIVKDSEGNGVPGINVTATLSADDFTTASTVTVTTDSEGIAIFGDLTIEDAATGYTITFGTEAAGVADVTSNSFDITAATASGIESVSGDGQTALINTQLSDPFVVRVVDNFGNAIAGEDVSFTISGVPSDASGQSVSNLTDTSDADGLTSTTLTLGDTAGTYAVDAVFNGVTITFTADATN
ncbi:filamin/ABP280 repeat domain-containing protein [Rhodohalobacter sp. 8-1]|uniref:filamin/ABP280 repeat domain-containing protein n=1 Tax=Rhodohalobacter sp. 8-1 TaxID=3131972 RepID=UPI0030ECE343